MGQSRGINSMKVKRAMNEKHTSTVSLPFEQAANVEVIAGVTNTMEIFYIKAAMLFAWAPTIGTKLKYNNAKVKEIGVESVSTASLSTVGTHAFWATFDQQGGSFPTSGSAQVNEAAIQKVITEMKQTGQYQLGSAVARLGSEISIPDGIKNFNFQDVSAPDTNDGYDPTTIMHLIRIYPKAAAPVTHVNFEVAFSGLGPVNNTVAESPTVPAYDEPYQTSDLSIAWLRQAFDRLQRLLPVENDNGDIEWIPSLFVVAIGSNYRKMFLWKTADEAALSASWDKLFFPQRVSGGKLNSELTELCYHKVEDQRLDKDEKYYAHATMNNWEFDYANIAAGLYVRQETFKPVAQRTADEILSSVVNNHGLNVNLGQDFVEA